MDRESRIIEESKGFLPFINEEFLISASNKGVYKRSVKDLEKIRDSIALSVKEAGSIEASLEDVTVTLHPNIQNSVCSCPSGSICKHIVMALLFVREYYDQFSHQEGQEEKIKADDKEEPKEKEKQEPYQELKDLTVEQAVSLIGKKEFQSLIRSVSIKNEAKFEYGDLLTVTISSQGSKVYFPVDFSIQNAMCSCKEKGICKHKSYALIAYLMENNKLDQESSIEGYLEIGEKETELLLRVQNYITALLDTGLSSLTESEIKRTEKFYIQTYGMKFFAMAAEMKSLSSELHFYFTKNVSFSSQRMLRILCGIYNRASALLSAKENGRKRNLLAGQRTEDKFSLDNITVTGLGTVCRLTKRNDLLLTAYFYCWEMEQFLSMSTLRPLEDHNRMTPEYLYKTGMVWSDEFSFMTVSTSNLALKNAMLTSGKLSSTKSTICKIKEETEEKDILKIAVSDFNELKEKLKSRSFRYFDPYSEVENIFLIQVQRIEKIEFDKINQKLNFSVFDQKDQEISFEIKYSPVTQTAIQYLESRKKTQLFQYILGSITEKNNLLKGVFLSGFSDGKVKNIFFKQGDRYGR